MFVDDRSIGAPPHIPDAAAIPARRLLQACAREAWRQAAEAARLDAAFGDVLAATGTPAPDGTSQGLTRTISEKLQQIDRLRQETQGLAALLDHLAALPSLASPVSTDQLRSCVPLVTQQDRLMSPPVRT